MSSAPSFRQLAGIQPTVATTKDSILIIIDAQNEYATGHLKVSNISTSRPNIQELLERYRSNNGHIAHIVHVVPNGTPVFTPNTELAEEFSELKPSDAEAPKEGKDQKEVTVKKHFPGSFTETELDAIVKGTGLKKVVLVGYMAHVCVSSTAREAHSKGLEVVVVEDAVGDRDIPGATGEEVREMVLKELGDFFATVVKTEEIK